MVKVSLGMGVQDGSWRADEKDRVLPLSTNHRNSETIHLQYKHLQFNGPRRQGGSPGDPRFFVISLERRKNWQRRLDSKDELRGECRAFNNNLSLIAHWPKIVCRAPLQDLPTA